MIFVEYLNLYSPDVYAEVPAQLLKFLNLPSL